MKKVYIIFGLLTTLVLFQSGVNYSGQPDQGLTGATGAYCTNCHTSNPINTGGGSVSVTGLPTNGYVPNQTYPISITITHGTANRRKWGFSMAAVNSGGANVGIFSTTNPNAKLNGNELSHFNAVLTSSTNTYTYTNLAWKAPATASGIVTFYYVGNAANGSGTAGDFIYSGTANINVGTIPITLKSINATNENNQIVVNWETSSEINVKHFDVERSEDGQFFYSLEKIAPQGNGSKGAKYTYRDTKATNVGVIYYRLKTTDNDGSEKYSPIVSAKSNTAAFALKKVYPTIISNGEGFSVEVQSEKNRNLTITLLDINGRTIQTQNFNINEGSNILKVNNANLANTNGLVLLQVASDNFLQTKTLMCK
jgi:Reeler domain